MFFRDYYHRTRAIDFHIGLLLYLIRNNGEILHYENYYDYSDSNRNNANLVSNSKLVFEDGSFFIPDAILKIRVDSKTKIFTFEIYNGLDTKRVLKQLYKHVKSLQEGLPSLAFNSSIWSRVLLLFDNPSCMKAVMLRMQEDSYFNEFQKYFLFSSVELIQWDFN